MKPTTPVEITTHSTANVHLCLFEANRPIYPHAALSCRSSEAAKGIPLFESLFAIEGVTRVSVSDNTLTVEKHTGDDWQSLEKRIVDAVRTQIESGKPLVPDSPTSTTETPDDEIRQRIQTLLTTQVAPALAAHGGAVKLVDVKNGEAFLELSGGCRGCAASRMTLQDGIARLIRQEIPEVTKIHDVTDHAGGTSPYYDKGS